MGFDIVRLMSRRMDWSRATEDAKTGKVRASEPRAFFLKPERARPFAHVYAAYAKRMRLAGRVPLPPLRWIESLRAKKV